MTDFAAVSQALADLQAAIGNLSGAIEAKGSADVALAVAQAEAADAAQRVYVADSVADAALELLVAALAGVGVGPVPSGPPEAVRMRGLVGQYLGDERLLTPDEEGDLASLQRQQTMLGMAAVGSVFPTEKDLSHV